MTAATCVHDDRRAARTCPQALNHCLGCCMEHCRPSRSVRDLKRDQALQDAIEKGWGPT